MRTPVKGPPEEDEAMTWTTKGLLTACLGVALALPGTPADAAVSTYDLKINVKAETIQGQVIKVKVTGTMTYDDVSGQVTFQVTEDSGVQLTGTGLMGKAKLSIAQTTFDAGDGMGATFYSGTAFFKGKFNRSGSRFTGKFYSVANSFGAAPNGYTFNGGTMTATLRTTP